MTSDDFDRLNDASLVDLCNGGSPREASRAFNALYRRHKSFVLRVVMSVLPDNSLALDALQETFTWLLRRFPPTGEGLQLTAKMTTLLYPVAKNSAITQWRKANRLAANADVDPDQLPAPLDSGESDLERVLRELSFERREVVTLRFVHDLSLADIAEALEIPVGTVKSRLNAAVTQLRNSPKIRYFFEK